MSVSARGVTLRSVPVSNSESDVYVVVVGILMNPVYREEGKEEPKASPVGVYKTSG